MPRFDIWSEGYLMTGQEGIPEPAQRMGFGYGATFVEACREWASRDKERQSHYRELPDGTPLHWVCRLFDNEADARESFG
jgi:hypothetical protein